MPSDILVNPGWKGRLTMRDLFHPTVQQLNLAILLNALGDPVRLSILKKLSGKTETTCSCCNVEMAKSALSHHFKVLREAGLINVRIDGKQRYLSIRYADLEARFPGLLQTVLSNIETEPSGEQPPLNHEPQPDC